MIPQCSKRILLSQTRLSIYTISRAYATQTGLGVSGAPRASRKRVTVTNDDGSVRWGDLSTGEKAARTAQQTFNLGLILAGMVMTGGVTYFLYKEVFSSDSATSHFNRAVDEIRANPRARELLGPAKKIEAFGEPSWNKWTRNRPIASSTRKDNNGRDHLLMHFNVKGPDGSGVVNVHMVKPSPDAAYEYKILSLDVPGNKTVYLRNTDITSIKKKPSGFKMLGVEWR